MQAVAVSGPEAIDVARAYAPVADFLLLDSLAPGIPGVGAAGVVHDWHVSAAIAADVQIPVVLAGGLIVAGFAFLRAPFSMGPLDKIRHLTVFQAARTLPLGLLTKLGLLRFGFVTSFLFLALSLMIACCRPLPSGSSWWDAEGAGNRWMSRRPRCMPSRTACPTTPA